jgi:hydroxyacylglutathione hydrolase
MAGTSRAGGTEALDVRPIPAHSDNYIWLFVTPQGGAAVVDPGDAEPVVAELDRLGVPLRHILLTHHHWDHTAGTDALRVRSDAEVEVIGFGQDVARLPRLSRAVAADETFDLGGLAVRVLAVPGHTSGHVAYVVADALFAGDTLFGYGCGRLFEGTPGEMWESLRTLRDLTGDRRVYCGHEYTANNLRFARHLEPDRPELRAVADEVAALRAAGRPTLPSSLDRERRLNPFLRCDDPAFVRALDLEGRAPDEVFGVLRARKDAF